MKRLGIIGFGFAILSSVLYCGVPHKLLPDTVSSPWGADLGDGMYRNPVLFADYSDPDVVRVGDDFILIASSFNCTPGIPILSSKDLVSWSIIGHVLSELPSPYFNVPRHGQGCWAPSIRFHRGEFFVFYGDPDFGIFMSKTRTLAGPWEHPMCIQEAKGWIDPCPLWDDDGNAYLIHAWAKSRVGFNSILTVHRMNPDGRKLLDEGTTVFDGRRTQPTIEGPKLYKRNGYYYIFAPAGGVSNGWQTVLRSKNMYGPYEEKIVLKQGSTPINGPHQGAWVETPNGESWFVHFQEHGVYGRVVHLQPMTWKNDWPIIGAASEGRDWGEPVMRWRKPDVGKQYPAAALQASDEFDSTRLGVQWQWHANHLPQWYSLTENPGTLRLEAVAVPDSNTNLWTVPSLLLQKFCAPRFTVTTKTAFSPAALGEKTGLLVMGIDYSYIGVIRQRDGLHVIKVTCTEAENGTPERQEANIPTSDRALYFRVIVDSSAHCRFSYSGDGIAFKEIGGGFPARLGKWIGAKVGIFSVRPSDSVHGGFAEYDWFRVE